MADSSNTTSLPRRHLLAGLALALPAVAAAGPIDPVIGLCADWHREWNSCVLLDESEEGHRAWCARVEDAEARIMKAEPTSIAGAAAMLGVMLTRDGMLEPEDPEFEWAIPSAVHSFLKTL